MSLIDHPEVLTLGTEPPTLIEHPPYSQRDRMIQRLDCRGDLHIRMEWETTPTMKYATGYTYYTEYSAHRRPRWVVHLGYRYRDIFAAFIGWDDVHVEGYDLDEVLREALRKSEPQRIWLYESVPAKWSAMRDMFNVMAGLNYPPATDAADSLTRENTDG